MIDLNAAAPTWRKVGSLQLPAQEVQHRAPARRSGHGHRRARSDGTSDTAKAVLTPEIWDPATGDLDDRCPIWPCPGCTTRTRSCSPTAGCCRPAAAGPGSAPDYPNAQLYSPEYLSLPSRPSITSLSSTVWTAGGTASLTVSSANGLGSVVLMGLPAVTHGIDTSARRIVLPITSAYNPGTGAVGVQVPSIANAPAGHYYAIALDGRGVPSEARIVQVVPAPAAARPTPAAAPAANARPAVARVVVDPSAAEKD